MPNSSKRMINIPRNIRTKNQAKIWLRQHYKSPVKLPVVNLSKPRARVSPVRRLAAPPKVNKSLYGFYHVNAYGSPNNPNVTYNCSMRKRLFHRETQNGRVGYHYMVANNWSNRLNLRTVNNTTVKKNLAKLGVGAQGAIFLGSFKRRAPPESNFIIKICAYDTSFKGQKQILDTEYDIHKKIYDVVPRHIPKVLAPLIKCQNFVDPEMIVPINKKPTFDYTRQNIMCVEYLRNGSLAHYLQALASSRRPRLTDVVVKSFIYQVLKSLQKIRTVYPEFRHNDLHLGNVFVKYGYPYPIMLIGDFGWSRLNGTYSNPFANSVSAFAENYGVGKGTSAKYDHHYFLNELRRALNVFNKAAKDGLPETHAFLNRVIPPGYREEKDTYTSFGRLKYGMDYPGLRTLDEIINDTYFTGAVSPKNRASPWRPGKAASPPKAASPKAPPPVLNPKPLAPAPRVFTNEELKMLSAGQFLNLSPKTKARATALRKPAANRKPALLNLGKGNKKPAAASAAAPRNIPTIPRNMLKDPRFNRLAVKLMSPARNGNNGYEKWNRARNRAIAIVANRLKQGKSPFSPAAAAAANAGPAAGPVVRRANMGPRNKVKLPKRPKAQAVVKRKGNSAPPPARKPNKPKPAPPKKPIKATQANAAQNRKAIKSPGGRVKILSNAGRYVYAEGQTLNKLRSLAANMRVNVSGLKTKKNIAAALFSAA